jgi:hypothetical protein
MCRSLRAILTWTIVGLLLFGPAAAAHGTARAAVQLTPGEERVDAVLLLPADQLEFAMNTTLGPDWADGIHAHEQEIQDYLAANINVASPNGTRWSMTQGPLRLENATDMEAPNVALDATFVPPDGVVGPFVLTDRAIVSSILTHKIVVTVTRDGRTVVAGVASSWDQSIEVDPRSESSVRSTVSLGFEHVSQGVDHLLFLLTLLLVAPFRRAGTRWRPRDRAGASLGHVALVATSFTVGHSVTLVLSAVLGWQPSARVVEPLIALSIAVAALHAIRPLVLHGESIMAGGFGLVHGLAFGAILEGYHLADTDLAVGLLGFNVGVELAQLVAIVLLFPTLYLTTRTRWAMQVRVALAAVAMTASALWVVARIGWTSNHLAPIEEFVIAHPLLLSFAFGTVGLALYSLHGHKERKGVVAVESLPHERDDAGTTMGPAGESA